jgi:hypothetical protein
MEAKESVKIIEQMLNESKKSLVNSSFYFILWAVILIPAGIIEWYLFGEKDFWLVWPIVSVIGGIISMTYGIIQSKKTQVKTAADRISSFTWTAFGMCMVFAIFYALSLHQLPHALILLLAGASTFISGGICKFKPFTIGGLLMIVAAVLCGFFVPADSQGLIFSAGILIGYLVPGLMLRRSENG